MEMSYSQVTEKQGHLSLRLADDTLSFWQLEVMCLLAHSKDFPNDHKNVRSHTEKDSKHKILQLKHWFFSHNGEVLSTQKEPLLICCPTM